MKTIIAAVITVALLANREILADEPISKPSTRGVNWHAVVKPDGPAASAKDAFVATTTAPASKLPGNPLYYSAQRSVPPLPFNPHPELPVYDLGNRKFLYDDRDVDYQKLHTQARMLEVASQPAGVQAGGIMAMVPGALSVGITYDPPAGFLLDVYNMTPGVYYGIGSKNSMNSDPFNTWTLVSVFEAQAADEQLSGTIPVAKRFYAAVDLDSYVGPSVSVVSPTPGTTVSGDVALQVQVTDILPLLSMDVYVGAVQIGVIRPGQNGVLNLPTYWFANGQHEIWVRAVNEGVPVDTDGDAVADDISPFQGWGSVTLDFSNEVYMQNYSPLYSAAGSITLKYAATSPQDYTFEVFRLNGTLLHTANGQSINGTMNPQWNFTDLLGQPVADAGYAFALTYSPHSGGQGAKAVGKFWTTNYVDSGVSIGKYVISYGEWSNSTYNVELASLSRVLCIGVNGAAYYDEDVIGAGREAYGNVYVNFHSDPFPIRQATQTNDLLALTNALRDSITGSWYFDGHGGPDGLTMARTNTSKSN